ncbi:MAG: hypothetical protein JW751_12480 [Polyangiaceae bacterium]|nr:hypothetical protein [Polyangiaceae bacterium]
MRHLLPTLLLALSACTRATGASSTRFPATQPPPEPCPPTQPSATGLPPKPCLPARTFSFALSDATTADPAEVSTHLTAIVASNPRLVWKGEGKARRVLVLTWTSWHGYDGKTGQTMDPSARPIWVTSVPELRDYCRALPPGSADRYLRITQLFGGLRPDVAKDRFVELWVNPDELFRPCPDPEIADDRCGLVLPSTVPPDYRQWFEDLRKTSYGDDGYPWTRLGCTYDWGNPTSAVGLSEFVVRQGSIVEVHAVTEKVDDYCR